MAAGLAIDPEPRRYFFMHIPKTAGSVLYQRLVRHHGDDAVYPLPPDRGQPGAYMDLDYLKDRLRAHQRSVRVVAGHFPLCLDEILGIPLTTFTVLRDPVERSLSLLRQHQQRDEEFRSASLEDVYNDPVVLHGMIHNFMVRVLTMTADETSRGVMTMVPYDEDRLGRAKENLEHRVVAFGLQEDFDGFCSELSARFGWEVGGPVTFENRTTPVDASDELRERIARDNALDVELFRFAQELSDREGGSRPIPRSAGLRLG
jgi:hypothetical protein